jgi:hypothetical protein
MCTNSFKIHIKLFSAGFDPVHRYAGFRKKAAQSEQGVPVLCLTVEEEWLDFRGRSVGWFFFAYRYPPFLKLLFDCEDIGSDFVPDFDQRQFFVLIEVDPHERFGRVLQNFGNNLIPVSFVADRQPRRRVESTFQTGLVIGPVRTGRTIVADFIVFALKLKLALAAGRVHLYLLALSFYDLHLPMTVANPVPYRICGVRLCRRTGGFAARWNTGKLIIPRPCGMYESVFGGAAMKNR